MVASTNLSPLQQRLIKGLELLPDDISLCLLNGNKVPQGKDWQNRPYSKAEVSHAIAQGIELENSEGKKYRFYPQGYGLMAGYPITVDGEKRYLLVVDQDGSSAKRKIEEMSGGDIAPTIKTTSGRKDRCHRIYYVTEEYASHLHTRKIATGELGEDGKREHVEFLWRGRQAVLPPSVHPMTGCYQYLDCSGLEARAITHAQNWGIEEMLRDAEETPQLLSEPERPTYISETRTSEKWSDTDWALSYLNALSSYRADDYDDWLAVGMALHSIDDSLLTDWDRWSRQSQKYAPGDCEKKWKSFERGGKIKIGSLAHMAKQDGWRSPFDKPTGRGFSGGLGSNNRRGSSGGSGGGDGGDGGDGGGNRNNGKLITHPKFTPASSDEIEAHIDALIVQKTSGSKLTSCLNRLAVESQWHVTELRKLYFERKGETEQSEEQVEAQSLLPSLLQVNRLNLREFLWGDDGLLAEAMLETAKAMPTSPEFLLTTLIPTAATLIGTSSRIIVKAKGKYKQPCIFWTTVVARSGQLKTPAQTVILDPLIQLEIKASEQYQLDLEQYEIDLTNWKKDKEADPADKPKQPLRKRYITKDATIEALERIHGQNPRGLLVHRDEIAEDFKADNAYRQGKGGDKEKKLDQWNGSPLIVDRQEREIALERSAISRTGSIQWDVLQSLMGDGHDDNGTFARWLFCAAEAPPRFINLLEDDTDTGIEELLTHLYKRLEKMPENRDYLLSFEAKQLFQQWQHELVRAELEETHPGLQLVYPKIEAYTARFALLLHVVNAALAEATPPAVIGDRTMSAAIKLAKYYLEQSKLVLATNSPQSGLTGVLLKIQKYAQGKPNGVKVYTLKSSIKSLRKTSKEELLSHCTWLSEHGYGSLADNVYRADFVDQFLPKGSTRSTPDSAVVLANPNTDLLTNSCPVVNTVNTSNDKGSSSFVDFLDQNTPPNLADFVTEVNIPHSVELCNEKDQDTIEMVNTVNIVNKSGEPYTESGVDHDQQLVKKGQESQEVDSAAIDLTEISDTAEAFMVGERVIADDFSSLVGAPHDPDLANLPRVAIAQLPVAQTPEVEKFSPVAEESSATIGIGVFVFWTECPAHCESFSPFEVTAIDGDYAKLDLFEKPVPIAELRRA